MDDGVSEGGGLFAFCAFFSVTFYILRLSIIASTRC